MSVRNLEVEALFMCSLCGHLLHPSEAVSHLFSLSFAVVDFAFVMIL
jgi:hypothetical protein